MNELMPVATSKVAQRLICLISNAVAAVSALRRIDSYRTV